MYKIPATLRLDELIGQQVNLIKVGPYDAQVAFEKGLVIQSEYKLEGEVLGVRTLWFDGEWVTTNDVLRVPKNEVVAVSRESDLTLKVQLTNGIALYFHTEESPYESINIKWPDGRLEVI